MYAIAIANTLCTCRRITELTDADVKYGTIPKDHWVQPSWIDENRASKARDDMVKNKVIYGGSVPYRNMCRFNSGVCSKSTTHVVTTEPLAL